MSVNGIGTNIYQEQEPTNDTVQFLGQVGSINGVNDAPTTVDGSANLEVGDYQYVFSLNDFRFDDGAKGNSLQSVIITQPPTSGTMTWRSTLRGVA